MFLWSDSKAVSYSFDCDSFVWFLIIIIIFWSCVLVFYAVDKPDTYLSLHRAGLYRKRPHQAPFPGILEASMNCFLHEVEVGSFCFNPLVLWWTRECRGGAIEPTSANCCLYSPPNCARLCLTCQSFKTGKTDANYLGIPWKVRALHVDQLSLPGVESKS